MSRLHLLYVDDDPDIRTIVRLAMQLDPDITLSEAASGAEALALVAGGVRPDAAVVDVMMPGMTGPMLMEALHRLAATASLPVIVMSAKARAADVSEYRARGAIGVIAKPFDPLTLAIQVRGLLAIG